MTNHAHPYRGVKVGRAARFGAKLERGPKDVISIDRLEELLGKRPVTEPPAPTPITRMSGVIKGKAKRERDE